MIYSLIVEVAGKCGDSVANTDWAACLVAEADESCPHGFLRLEEDFACATRGYRRPPYKKRVCCLMAPVFDLKVSILSELCMWLSQESSQRSVSRSIRI